MQQHLQKRKKCAISYTSLRTVQPKFTSKEGHGQMNIMLFQRSIKQFTLIPTYLLFFSRQILLCNTQYFYAADGDIYPNDTLGMYCCCISTATLVRRTRHTVTLYVGCIACLLMSYYRLHSSLSSIFRSFYSCI